MEELFSLLSVLTKEGGLGHSWSLGLSISRIC